MISEVVMPQMGADMEEGTVVRWLKQPGDAVERGEIIAEIETDKANVEIEAFDSGTFRKTLASEGDTISVGTVIALITDADEDISQYQPATSISSDTQEAATAAPSAPKARTGADDETEADTATTTSSTPAPSRPTASIETTPGRVRASPVARKLAQENGIDLTQVSGTGPDGRIVRRDIEAAPDPVARRHELEEMLNKYRSPFRTAEAFGIEEIIDPRDTRPFLCEWVESAYDVLPSQLGQKPRVMRP